MLFSIIALACFGAFLGHVSDLPSDGEHDQLDGEPENQDDVSIERTNDTLESRLEEPMQLDCSIDMEDLECPQGERSVGSVGSFENSSVQPFPGNELFLGDRLASSAEEVDVYFSDSNYQENSVGSEFYSQPLNVFKIDSSSTNSDFSVDPFTNFFSDPNMQIFNIDELDYIDVDLEPEVGRVAILRADYYEKFENGLGLDLENLHTGVNLYYIPNDKSFPEEYLWSSDTASLYSNLPNMEIDDNVGGVRLLLRVNTGFLHNVSSGEAGLEYSNLKFEVLSEMLTGNGNHYLV